MGCVAPGKKNQRDALISRISALVHPEFQPDPASKQSAKPV